MEGVMGFVLKKAGINELEKAILSVYEGKNYFSQDLLQKLVLNSLKPKKQTNKPEIGLTKRELEVLELISCGLSNHEIGEKLFISHLTVNNHRSRLLLKTRTKNTASLLMFAIKTGFLIVKTE